MFTNRLKSGERVFLHEWGGTGTKGIPSRLVIFKPSEQEAHVSAPLVDGRPVKLSADMYYELRVYAENSEFRFKAKFLSDDEVYGFAISRFMLMNEGEKLLRRNAYRINIDTAVSFSVVYEDGHQYDRDEARVVDLSVGGAKIQTDMKIEKGELLNLSIQLGNELIIAFGDIKYAEPMPHSTDPSDTRPKYAYQYGISFVMLADSDKERVVQLMHKKKKQESINANRNHE